MTDISDIAPGETVVLNIQSEIIGCILEAETNGEVGYVTGYRDENGQPQVLPLFVDESQSDQPAQLLIFADKSNLIDLLEQKGFTMLENDQFRFPDRLELTRGHMVN